MPNLGATAANNCCFACQAALRTAGEMEPVVTLPPESGPIGKRVSPMRMTMLAGGTPSSSATTTASMVLVPVPRSCTADINSTEPSREIRTSQDESILTKRYQTDCAIPMPRLTGPVSAPAGLRLRQFVRSRMTWRSTFRAGCSSILSRSANGSMFSFTASSSMACSKAKQPCGWPGARNAAPGLR